MCIRKSFIFAVAAAVLGGLSFATGAAEAGFSALKGEATAAGSGLVQQIHGCHTNVRSDRYGPHRHVGRSCRRVDTRPRRPVCWRDCNYVGPIKVCKTKCR